MLSFREWIAKTQDGSIEWANNFVTESMKSDVHYGDCTSQSCPCDLCIMQDLLSDYRLYFKRESKKHDS